MEALEITDVLNENVLRYRLKGGASYIRDKRIKTFYPSSVSTYSSNSNSVIRFNLTGGANEWINLRSLLIGFTILNGENDGTKQLRPAYKPSSFFQRMRVMVGSNVIAEIPDLNRYEAMMDILQDDGSRNYTDNLGFGETFYNEGNRFLTYRQLATNPGADHIANITEQATPDNFGGFLNKKTVYYRPSCPFFNVSNFIPLSYCPIVIELTLVSDPLEPIVVSNLGDFTVTNTSTTWSIEQPLITADVHRLDDGLFAEYAEILEKQSLPITFNSVSVQTQTISRTTDIFTTIVRNVSKADNIFISFYSIFGYKGGFGEVLKPHNQLYHPLSWQSGVSTRQQYYEDLDLSFQLSIGNNVIPEMPTLGINDNYKHLQETRNNHVSIKPHMYRTNSFLAGFNLKKLNSANYTGLNLKNNSSMVVRVKPLNGTKLYTEDNGTDTGLMPDKMYIVIEHECILEIKAQSVIFYD